jgi:ribonucleotide reductase beta subunit family protein with ferritin-like domain
MDIQKGDVAKENDIETIKKLLEKISSDDKTNILSYLGQILNKKEEENILYEPILDKKNMKYTAYPIAYDNIWKLYKEQVASFWKAEEIDFSKDYEDFLTLNDDEQYFVEMLFAFFAASDGIVNFNLIERFLNEICNTEILFTYQFQAMMENIHCVSGDTFILTDKGYFQIGLLENKNIRVWNGCEFSEVTVRNTGKSCLYRVSLSNGMHLDCTPEHKWFIDEENNEGKKIVFSRNLEVGNIIYDYELPIINSEDDSLEEKIGWFEEICEAIGIFYYNDCELNLNISDSNLELIGSLQFMLTILGVNSELYDSGLNINEYEIQQLFKLGFNPRTINLHNHVFKNCIKRVILISHVEILEGISDTYCFNEPFRHAGIFNGILTGQSEVYSLMLDNIVKDVKKKEFLFNAIENVESVKMMADWAFKWIESPKSFSFRVIAFAIVEGVFFSGAFAAIFWLKKYKNKNNQSKGKPFMDGLIKSNKFIARDEGMHARTACEIYGLLNNKLSNKDVHEIMDEGVKIAENFMIEALPVRLIGMNSESMCNYIEYIADRLLGMLGHNKIYNKKNPFKFMETIGLSDKTNFFETRPTEYQDPHVMNVGNKSDITINDDF